MYGRKQNIVLVGFLMSNHIWIEWNGLVNL